MNITDFRTADNVKKIVDGKGLKRSYAAKLCGYSQKRFSDLLNGRKLILPTDVKNLCEGLGITPNELYGINETA